MRKLYRSSSTQLFETTTKRHNDTIVFLHWSPAQPWQFGITALRSRDFHSVATIFHRFHMDVQVKPETSQSPVTSCLEVRFHVPVILSSLTRDNDRDLGSPQYETSFPTFSKVPHAQSCQSTYYTPSLETVLGVRWS